jgi:hypothetical protein
MSRPSNNGRVLFKEYPGKKTNIGLAEGEILEMMVR